MLGYIYLVVFESLMRKRRARIIHLLFTAVQRRNNGTSGTMNRFRGNYIAHLVLLIFDHLL